jgi:hypothetical protein
MTTKTTAEGNGGGMLRRTILLLAVAAVLVAMMVAMAAPAFAKGPKFGTCVARLNHVVETGHGRIPPPCPFSLP